MGASKWDYTSDGDAILESSLQEGRKNSSYTFSPVPYRARLVNIEFLAGRHFVGLRSRLA